MGRERQSKVLNAATAAIAALGLVACAATRAAPEGKALDQALAETEAVPPAVDARLGALKSKKPQSVGTAGSGGPIELFAERADAVQRQPRQEEISRSAPEGALEPAAKVAKIEVPSPTVSEPADAEYTSGEIETLKQWQTPDPSVEDALPLTVDARDEAGEIVSSANRTSAIDEQENASLRKIEGAASADERIQLALAHLGSFPQGTHRSGVLDALESALLAKAQEVCDPGPFGSYAQHFDETSAQHGDEMVELKQGEEAYMEAIAQDTYGAFRLYLTAHPDGPCAELASKRLTPAYWEARGGDPHALIQLAESYFDRGEQMRGLEHLRRAASTGDLAAKVQLGVALAANQEPEEARALLTEATTDPSAAARPALWEAHYQLGLLDKERELYPEATRHLTTAIELNPSCAPCYYERAVLHLRDLKEDSARMDLEKARDFANAAESGWLEQRAKLLLEELGVSSKVER